MALETGTYISDLVATNPASSDNVSTADDHLRLIKSTIKASFPNITGAANPTQTELNLLVGASALGDVTTSGTQTLTNKTIALGSNTVSGTTAQFNTALTDGDFATLAGTETLTNKTVTNIVFDGSLTEEVYTLGTSGSIALNAANGTVQTCALTGNPTFTDSLSAGQSVVLLLTSGSSYTVTWPTITWVKSGGSAAPTLTANDTLVFWKIGSTLYGAYVGSGV